MKLFSTASNQGNSLRNKSTAPILEALNHILEIKDNLSEFELMEFMSLTNEYIITSR